MNKLVMSKLVKIVLLGTLRGSLLMNSVLPLKLLLTNVTKNLMRISIKLPRLLVGTMRKFFFQVITRVKELHARRD